MTGFFFNLCHENLSGFLEVKSLKVWPSPPKMLPREFSLFSTHSASSNSSKLPLKCYCQFMILRLLFQVSRSRLYLSRGTYLQRFSGWQFSLRLQFSDWSKKRITDFQVVQLFVVVRLGVTTFNHFTVRTETSSLYF